MMHFSIIIIGSLSVVQTLAGLAHHPRAFIYLTTNSSQEISSDDPLPFVVLDHDSGFDSIIGGDEVLPDSYPQIVSLITTDAAGSGYSCGGTLINALTVLTAAHCSQNLATHSVEARIGSHALQSGGQEVDIIQIINHPEFDARTMENDVALWRLAAAVPQGPGVKYVTLPGQGDDPQPGLSAVVAGWGKTNENAEEATSHLREVGVSIVSRSQCQESIGNLLSLEISVNEICAGGDEGKDACQGDSGGPLFDKQKMIQIGIVSFGEGCGRPGLPGVYTRVGYYRDWIERNKWMN